MQELPDATKEFDVAISCLAEDEPTASALFDRLDGRMSTFLYTQRQKELIGEEGVEVFSQIFRRQSRIVIVIHRATWGSTNWSGVEDRAIRELYWDGGWKRVVVHSLDGTAPRWLPQNMLWSSDRYGLVALAAVIERKVQEEGGKVGEEDVVAKAQREGRLRKAAQRREDRRSTDEAVRAAEVEVGVVREHFSALTDQVKDSIEGGAAFRQLAEISTAIARDAAVGLWWQPWANNSIRRAKITLLLSDGPLSGGQWKTGTTSELADFALHLAEDESTWLWVDEEGRRFTSANLAVRAMRLLLDELDLRAKAKLLNLRRGD